MNRRRRLSVSGSVINPSRRHLREQASYPTSQHRHPHQDRARRSHPHRPRRCGPQLAAVRVRSYPPGNPQVRISSGLAHVLDQQFGGLGERPWGADDACGGDGGLRHRPLSMTVVDEVGDQPDRMEPGRRSRQGRSTPVAAAGQAVGVSSAAAAAAPRRPAAPAGSPRRATAGTRPRALRVQGAGEPRRPHAVVAVRGGAAVGGGRRAGPGRGPAVGAASAGVIERRIAVLQTTPLGHRTATAVCSVHACPTAAQAPQPPSTITHVALQSGLQAVASVSSTRTAAADGTRTTLCEPAS